MPSTIVILGSGGTIAGVAAQASDHVGYRSAQRGVAELLAAVPSLQDQLQGQAIACEQVAQIDSKDMDHATWQLLAQRAAHHLQRPEVAGVVITHGTDTLEETAWFLHRVLAPTKPLVLTAAMRPATALAADGPQNLLDAVSLAREPEAQGVMVVLAGCVHGAADVRKLHPYRTDAFSSGDAGVLAHIEQGRLRRHRAWPQAVALGLAHITAAAADWPRVDVVHSHAGANGDGVRALLASGARGLVLAGTGNGSVHRALGDALQQARDQGVPVWICTRCGNGVVVTAESAPVSPAAALSPWQARIDLMLALMAPG